MAASRWSAGPVAGLVAAGVWLLAPAAAGNDWPPPPNPPEPEAAEVFREAGVDGRDPAALLARLDALTREHPTALDAWVPTLRRHEHWSLVTETAREPKPRAVSPERLAELRAARLRHPARVAEAVLRQLGAVGTPAQLDGLLAAAAGAKTEWGRWKCYAAVQDILARGPVEEAAGRLPPTPEAVRLLRDLPAGRRGELAAALFRRQPHEYDGWRIPATQPALWLAWSLADADPAGAAAVFRLGLELPDPAARLFAGIGLARVTGGPIPYRLTAGRRATAAAPAARRPDDYEFPDPLARPVVQHHRGDRADLWWLGADGAVARREEDVWPKVERVLPDGTFLSLAGPGVALTDPDGEVLVRFPSGRGQVDNVAPDGHGGFVALEDRGQLLVEYAVNGDRLWACPLDDGHASARYAAPAGPGRVLLVRYGRVEVLDRRGDVVWAVRDVPEDPRWACAIGPDTVLVAGVKAVEVHHRTRGRVRRVDGFTSVAGVRYHPTRPWLVLDGGAGAAVILDPDREARLSVRLGWGNDDPEKRSGWVRPVQLYPDR